MATVTYYVPYCPANDRCTKGWCRLGSHQTQEGAEQAIRNHLRNSQYHRCSDDEINDLMQAITVDTEEWPLEAPAEEPGKGKGANDAHGKGKGGKDAQATGKGKSSKGGHRSQPYNEGKNWQPQQPLPVVAMPPVPVQQQQLVTLVESLTKSATALRTASRFARQASAAFDEEASTIEISLRRLTGVQQDFTF